MITHTHAYTLHTNINTHIPKHVDNNKRNIQATYKFFCSADSKIRSFVCVIGSIYLYCDIVYHL